MIKSFLSIYTFSKLLLTLELAAQIVVVATESISNSLFRRFPPSSVMMSYTGQSLLVIIVAILIILMTLLVLRNLGRILVQTSWKISVSCMGFSLASIAFRTFSAWFIISASDPYYLASYNITSYFIIIGAVLWIPFIFCRSNKYAPEESSNVNAERFRIRSTSRRRGVVTHRPHQDEDNQSFSNGEELPSYYEMVPPPSYKNVPAVNSINGDNSSSLSPPAQRNSVISNINMTENNVSLPFNPINNNSGHERSASSPSLSINASLSAVVHDDSENLTSLNTTDIVINMNEDSAPPPPEYARSQDEVNIIISEPSTSTADRGHQSNDYSSTTIENIRSSTNIRRNSTSSEFNPSTRT